MRTVSRWGVRSLPLEECEPSAVIRQVSANANPVPCRPGPDGAEITKQRASFGNSWSMGPDPLSRAQVTRCLRQELLCLGTVCRHSLLPQACVQLRAENSPGERLGLAPMDLIRG